MRRDLHTRIAIASLFAAILSLVTSTGWSEAPQTASQLAFDMLSAEADETIIHSFKTRSLLDASLRRTTLSGPSGFLYPVSVIETDSTAEVETPRTFWNVYEITYGGSSEPREIQLTDRNHRQPVTMRLGDAKYFLSKAQWITTGAPGELEPELDFYKAYEIIGFPEQERSKLSLNTIDGESERELLKPAFVCLPVEESHHENDFPIHAADQCLIIYQSQQVNVARKLSTIDQFGLHAMKSTSSQLIALPGKINAADKR